MPRGKKTLPPDTPRPEGMLTVAEAAALAKVTTTTVRRWIKVRRLSSEQWNGQTMVPQARVEELAVEHAAYLAEVAARPPKPPKTPKPPREPKPEKPEPAPKPAAEVTDADAVAKLTAKLEEASCREAELLARMDALESQIAKLTDRLSKTRVKPAEASTAPAIPPKPGEKTWWQKLLGL